MFSTGAVLLPFFSLMSFFVAVPTGIKFFNWVGTMWRGQLTFEAPMLFILGFLATFLLGGLTGVILASPPLDFAVTDTYFLVAHFHYVLFGTVVFSMFAGFYFWWPNSPAERTDETPGKRVFFSSMAILSPADGSVISRPLPGAKNSAGGGGPSGGRQRRRAPCGSG
jgi:cytochrome c oxidase subunit I